MSAVEAQPAVVDQDAVTIHQIAQVRNPTDLKDLVRRHIAAKGIKARPTSLEPLNQPGAVAETPDPPETAQPAAEQPDLEPANGVTGARARWPRRGTWRDHEADVVGSGGALGQPPPES